MTSFHSTEHVYRSVNRDTIRSMRRSYANFAEKKQNEQQMTSPPPDAVESPIESLQNECHVEESSSRASSLVEEEEEPLLNYFRLSESLGQALKSDPATALVAREKLVVSWMCFVMELYSAVCAE